MASYCIKRLVYRAAGTLEISYRIPPIEEVSVESLLGRLNAEAKSFNELSVYFEATLQEALAHWALADKVGRLCVTKESLWESL